MIMCKMMQSLLIFRALIIVIAHENLFVHNTNTRRAPFCSTLMHNSAHRQMHACTCIAQLARAIRAHRYQHGFDLRLRAAEQASVWARPRERSRSTATRFVLRPRAAVDRPCRLPARDRPSAAELGTTQLHRLRVAVETGLTARGVVCDTRPKGEPRSPAAGPRWTGGSFRQGNFGTTTRGWAQP